MIYAILGFVVITAVSVWLHMRSAGEKASVRPTRACPRCHTHNPVNVTHCSACNVPLQALELVSAPVVDASAAADEEQGALHAMVRADVCVGCGACVPVCPEPGAIRLDGKLAVVDIQRCKGHGECVSACPVGGILLTSGAAVQRIETPDLDSNFQTNVPGLYVVGELGGRGLIKNAVNEGKIAIEHIAHQVKHASVFARSDDSVQDVIIVGSGPAGLSAGLEALRSELRYRVLEQGDLSDTIRKYPRHKLLLAEPVRVPLYGDLWVTDASKEALLEVWRTMIDKTGLQVSTNVRVESIAWTGDHFAVTSGEQVFHAHHVVLALGRRGTPRTLGIPGEELAKTLYDIVEMEAFEGAHMLVVGGGDSAIESAIGLAHQQGTTVTLSYRGSEFKRVKDRNREKLDAAVRDGRVRVLLNSQVTDIGAESVNLAVAGEPVSLRNDYVIVRIGGLPPFDFLRKIGIEIVTKELALDPAPESVGA